jgi:chemotaxis protein CheY-P-specific phosphatase CheC
MENLDVNELLVAKKIVKRGLLKAAESLSFFMKEEVGINELDFQINDRIEYPKKKGDNIHLLTTEVMGELPGICYLVFSEEEANKLREVVLAGEAKDNPELVAEMKDAIMLEVDNIISASVITEFSNILNHKIYGNVPSLKLVNDQELKKLVGDNLDRNFFVINFKTQFLSSNINFSPEFVWLFDSRFLNSIKHLVHSKESLHLLN